MTTKEEIKKLLLEGWILTDPSCNQMRKEIVVDNVYAFREDRIINPITKETGLYEDELCYDDLDYFDIINDCVAFGYNMQQIDKWISEGEEISLMLECVFELST